MQFKRMRDFGCKNISSFVAAECIVRLEAFDFKLTVQDGFLEYLKKLQKSDFKIKKNLQINKTFYRFDFRIITGDFNLLCFEEKFTSFFLIF